MDNKANWEVFQVSQFQQIELNVEKKVYFQQPPNFPHRFYCVSIYIKSPQYTFKNRKKKLLTKFYGYRYENCCPSIALSSKWWDFQKMLLFLRFSHDRWFICYFYNYCYYCFVAVVIVEVSFTSSSIPTSNGWSCLSSKFGDTWRKDYSVWVGRNKAIPWSSKWSEPYFQSMINVFETTKIWRNDLINDGFVGIVDSFAL